jgi:GTP-binding protein Era
MKKRITIALAGEPNAGKSTLINSIVGEKISIVTPKVQTTRRNLRAVIHIHDTEFIFIDTPGLFKPDGLLERSITRTAWQGIDEADCVCILFDARQKYIMENQLAILNGIQKREKEVFAIINKIDLVDKRLLLDLASKIDKEIKPKEIFMISALKHKGIEGMLNAISKVAPEGEWYFGDDDLTDTPIRDLAEEITREHLFLRLNKELPYSLKVETESWQEMKDGSLKVHQSIVVLRESQKKIVIGDNAETLKFISRASRSAISKLTGCKVHLFLHVKVKDNWIEDSIKL